MQRPASSTTTGASALPSISECLFGPSKKCPKLKQRTPSSPTKNTSPDSVTSSQYDGLGGRWGESAKQHDIDIAKLRRVCSQGIADEGSHRGVAWRVLLEYLETDSIQGNWPKLVPAKRDLYNSLVQQYFEGPLERGKDLRGQLSKLLRDRRLRKKYNQMESWDQPNEDGIKKPRSFSSLTSDGEESVMSEQTIESNVSAMIFTSAPRIVDRLPNREFQDAWKKAGIDLDAGNTEFTNQVVNLGINQLRISPKMNAQEFEIFLEDAKLLCEVRKDVARTHPDLFFYLEPKDHLGMRRYGALERILFIWAKLNKGVRYVQGMNEIIGTIYYVLANDHNSEWANHAEVDSYYLFHSLMMDMKDVFVPEMDESETGIQGRIDNLQHLLKTHDPEVFEHMKEAGIDASFFAIRWLTTLLSREFLLPDTIRLWDSMFASTHKENFLRYACATMVMMIRDDLLKGDFGNCLQLLQSYPPGDVDAILETSRSLYIYESKITLVCHKGGISLHQALQTISPPPSIIMAFGMRGGVAPRISMPFSNPIPAASNGSGSPPGSGLFGRVKNLWNKSTQKDGGAGVHMTKSNSAASGFSQEKNNDEATSIVTTATSTTTTTAATEATGCTAASNGGPPVSRIWNRSTREDIVTQDPPQVGSTTASVRRPIWNRGDRNRSAGSADEPRNRARADSTDSINNTGPRRNKFWKQAFADKNDGLAL